MSAEKLISRIEELGIVEAPILAKLRKLVAEARAPVSMEAVAKRLIADGQLTVPQAKKLIADINAQSGAKPAAPTKPAAPAAASPAKPAASPSVNDDMGLVPMDEVDAQPAAAAPAAAKSPPPKPAASADDMGLVPLEEVAEEPAAAAKPAAKTPAKPAAPAKPASAAKPAAAPAKPAAAPKPPAAESELVELEAIDETSGLTPLPDSGLTPLSDLASGGLDSGGMDSGLTPIGGPAPANVGTPGKAAPQIKKMTSGGWDSPLMLLGGGLLLLLLFAGAILLYSLGRGSADELFVKAEDEYKAQTYDKAIIIYDTLIKSYPTHPKASISRVRRGLARLRQVVDQSKDMRGALDLAKTVIPEIEVEEKFADGRDELAAMLPKIAEDFAARAKAAQTGKQATELVKLGEQAMELVNNPSYITTQMREALQTRIEATRRSLEEAKRTIQQDDALAVALTAIQKAADDGNTIEAFDLRRKLVKEFPALENDKKLGELVLKVAARERELVKVTTDTLAATREDFVPSIKAFKLVLSHRKGETASDVAGQVTYVLAAGSVFGIDVGSGKILWRRAVDFGATTQPRPLASEGAADALVVDDVRHELLRLDAKTGKLKWRLVIGEAFAPPAQPGTQLIVTTQSGQLWEVDPETGDAKRGVKMPQTLAIGVGGDARLPTFYQVGTHSNLYACSTDTLECREAFYLGHKPGTVTVPPVNVLNHLFVAENAGPDYCLLHVLKMDEAGLKLESVQEPFRLAGNVVVPPVQVRNRLTVLTTLGESRVIEIDSSRAKLPAKEVAKQVATAKSPEIGFPLADANVVWIASQRLSAFDIQTSRGQLNNRWTQHDGEPFVAPLQRFGNLLVHVRRRRGSGGLTVAASKMDSGQVVWRTDVAVPVTHVATGGAQSAFAAVNANGDLYRFANDALVQGLLDKPVESAEADGSEVAYRFGDGVALEDGRVVFPHQPDARSWLVFNPAAARDSVRVTKVPGNSSVTITSPQPFANGVLVPYGNGQVALLDVDTGKSRAIAFQPRIEPGTTIVWQPFAVLGADRKEAVLTDNRRKLFRLGLRDKPEPHLAALQEAEAPQEIQRPLAVAGDTLYAVFRDVGEDVIQAFSLPGLAPGKEFRLKGRVVDGPWQVGDRVLLTASVDGLLCFGPGQSQAWTAPLPHGALAGPPLFDGKSFIFASRRGQVWRAALDTGAVSGQLELREALLGAAVPVGKVLYFRTWDGSLVAIGGVPSS